jgi:hypothetical protein
VKGEQMDNWFTKRQKYFDVIDHLVTLGFNSYEFSILDRWFEINNSDEHWDWILNSSYDEIILASKPAFEEE